MNIAIKDNSLSKVFLPAQWIFKNKHISNCGRKLIRYRLHVYSLHLIIWTTVGAIYGRKVQIWDSGFYAHGYPNLFYKDGHFNLFEYRDTYRGFVLPLISLALQKISVLIQVDLLLLIIGLNIILLSIASCYLIPRLSQIIFPKISLNIVSLISLFFLIIFWGGYISYMLSDIPAAFFFLIATIALWGKRSYLNFFIFGVSCVAASNIRMSFILGTIFLLFTICVRELKEIKTNFKKTQLLKYIVLILGIAIVLLPQSLINQNTLINPSASPLPLNRYPTSGSYETPRGNIPIESDDISIFQIMVGLGLQRYETASTLDSSSATLQFIDPSGFRLIQNGTSIHSTSEYLRLWKDEPIILGSVTVRHFLNGFDQQWSSPYIDNVNDRNQPFIYFWYGLIGVSLIGTGYVLITTAFHNSKSLITVLLLTVLSISTPVLGAVESRFFLFPSLVIIALGSGFLLTHFKEIYSKRIVLYSVSTLLLIFIISYAIYSEWVIKQLA